MKKKKKEEKIESDNEMGSYEDYDEDGERIAIGEDSDKMPSYEMSVLDKEELEEVRVKYARELGQLMNKGIKEYGALWTIGLIQCGLTHRINEYHKKNNHNFFSSFRKVLGL